MAKSKLKRRLALEEESEAQWSARLAGGKKDLQAKQAEKKAKRKDAKELYTYVSPDVREDAIRPVENFKYRSYNIRRQVMSLIKHLFVKYPVPAFMYHCMLKIPTRDAQNWSGTQSASFYVEAKDRYVYDSFDRRGSNWQRYYYMYDMFREWFLCLAQGGSFQKAVKGVMTKKEAVMFLKAPYQDEIVKNVWWARLMCLGFSKANAERLIDRLIATEFFDDPDDNIIDVLHFYNKYIEDMDDETFEELTDYIRRKVSDKEFRFKGRTLTSVIRLSNEWHLEIVMRQRADRAIQRVRQAEYRRENPGRRTAFYSSPGPASWKGTDIKNWSMDSKRQSYTVQEITTSKALANEGAKQGHCVGSYASRCCTGQSAIFSLRVFAKGKGVAPNQKELTRLTIEIKPDSRRLYQVKGKSNRTPTNDENLIVRMWAGEKGIKT